MAFAGTQAEARGPLRTGEQTTPRPILVRIAPHRQGHREDAALKLEVAMLTCYAKGCHCGQPIVIRTIGGRKVPIHNPR